MATTGAKVTAHPAEASHLVAGGTPAVLVGEDAGALGRLLPGYPDEAGHQRLLALMVGDPADPAVAAAAHEMAAELWPWAGPHPPAAAAGRPTSRPRAFPRAVKGARPALVPAIRPGLLLST